MSKVAIKGASTGTGTFTIESPATNTDRTLTLPDAAGTVALTTDIPAAPTIASTAEAEAGTNNTNLLTPLRLREGFNASGSAPVYACRAWVNLNGTNTTIRASGNVSSVSKTATGQFIINFATALPDANYAAGCSATIGGSSDVNRSCAIGPINTTSAYLNSWQSSSGLHFDVSETHAVIFR